MDIEKQVTSLELSKRLKELGVKQESFLWWTPYMNGELLRYCVSTSRNWKLPSPFYDKVTDCSAFTVAELGEMLPYEVRAMRKLTATSKSEELFGYQFTSYKNAGSFSIGYANNQKLDGMLFTEENEANARALMMVYLLENNLIQI